MTEDELHNMRTHGTPIERRAVAEIERLQMVIRETDAMGHYRSEMGLEHEDRQTAQRAEERRRKTVRRIQDDIKARGIEEVLADIVLDPTTYKIRCL